ncbi:hypothetical protein ACFY3G_35065 [Streptomyces phaeochromogenes]|uniref:hypothetical protein n=1 Tax=Streptomyces phaeochromogenes TaxID=1923 RepID=UPI0036B3D9E7
MTAAAVVLACIAAALEIWGLVWTVLDIQQARKNVAKYLELPGAVSGTVGATLGAVEMTAEGTVGTPTLEQRIEELEIWRRGMRDDLKQREQKLTERLAAQFQGGLQAAGQASDDQFKKLRGYIEGSQQSVWDSYRGPIVLGIGVLVGLAGGIVSAL